MAGKLNECKFNKINYLCRIKCNLPVHTFSEGMLQLNSLTSASCISLQLIPKDRSNSKAMFQEYSTQLKIKHLKSKKKKTILAFIRKIIKKLQLIGF